MIVDACALREDLDRFPSGDLCFVGERGIILSGGQRARVGLARAIYSEADIYLLDDPLSAVDAKVGSHIVKYCLQRLLSEKLVVLVTHRLQYLQSTDRVVVMNDGCIEKETCYSELTSSDDLLFDDKIFEEETSDGTVYNEKVADFRATGANDEKEVVEGTQEDRQYGGVSWRTYWRYIHAGNSVAYLIFMVFAVILPEGTFDTMF